MKSHGSSQWAQLLSSSALQGDGGAQALAAGLSHHTERRVLKLGLTRTSLGRGPQRPGYASYLGAPLAASHPAFLAQSCSC